MFVRTRWFYLIAAAPMLALAADSLDVRPGLWQISMTVQSQGSLIPQSVLDQMPKDQRDKLLAQMAKPRPPTISKSCVTAEEIRKGAFSDIGAEDRGSCKLTITSGTKTLQEGTQVCTGDSPRTSHIRMEMLGREQLKGTLETATPNGKVAVQMAGKWIAATCTKDDED